MNHVRALKVPYGISRHRMALFVKQQFVALVDHVRVLRNPYSPEKAVTGVHKPVRHPQGPVRCPYVHRMEPVGETYGL